MIAWPRFTRPALAAALLSFLWAAPAHADLPLPERLARLDARLAVAPGDTDLHLERAELLLRAGREREALTELDLLDALRPDATRSDRMRARVLFESGLESDALALLSLAITDHDALASRRLRATFYSRLGRLEEALLDYDVVVRTAPDLETELARGRVLERLGRFDEAALSYETTLARTGATAARTALIAAERQRGAPQRALPHVDALIAASRVAPRWRVLRAEVLVAMGRDDSAREELDRALAEADRMVRRRASPLSLMERGRVHLARGERAAARADLQQAIRRAPRLREAQTLLIEAGGAS
ncbi:MAG: tetratricopeptide repeat protein [Sandaracinaceae bacterium]